MWKKLSPNDFSILKFLDYQFRPKEKYFLSETNFSEINYYLERLKIWRHLCVHKKVTSNFGLPIYIYYILVVFCFRGIYTPIYIKAISHFAFLVCFWQSCFLMLSDVLLLNKNRSKNLVLKFVWKIKIGPSKIYL